MNQRFTFKYKDILLCSYKFIFFTVCQNRINSRPNLKQDLLSCTGQSLASQQLIWTALVWNFYLRSQPKTESQKQGARHKTNDILKFNFKINSQAILHVIFLNILCEIFNGNFYLAIWRSNNEQHTFVLIFLSTLANIKSHHDQHHHQFVLE